MAGRKRTGPKRRVLSNLSHGVLRGAFENDGVAVNRIQKVKEWIPHLEKLGIGAIYFSPVFESDTHGYDTRDFKKIDCRLGTNQDFKEVCEALHQAGIRVVLDGVFNHVGRGFWAFQDVKEKREASPIRTGSTSTLEATAATTTASGTRLGGPLRAGKAEPAKPGGGGLSALLRGRLDGGVLHRRPAAGRGLPVG